MLATVVGDIAPTGRADGRGPEHYRRDEFGHRVTNGQVRQDRHFDRGRNDLQWLVIGAHNGTAEFGRVVPDARVRTSRSDEQIGTLEVDRWVYGGELSAFGIAAVTGCAEAWTGAAPRVFPPSSHRLGRARGERRRIPTGTVTPLV